MPRQVSLLSYQDLFVCSTCLGHNCLAMEKIKLKRREDVLDEVGCTVIPVTCLAYMVEHLKWFVQKKVGLEEAQGVRSSFGWLAMVCLLSSIAKKFRLSKIAELRLYGVEHHTISMICGLILVDRISNDFLRKKIE